MFSKNKGSKSSKSSSKGKERIEHRQSRSTGSGANLSGFVPGDEATENDDELEAELAALTGVYPSETKIKMTDNEDDDLEAELMSLIGSSTSKTSLRPSVSVSTSKNLDINLPLKDLRKKLEKDFSLSDDETVDENDEDLLNELHEITSSNDEEILVAQPPSSPVKEKTILSVMQERLALYKEAETNAKLKNELARARRFNRGIVTLQKLIKIAESGGIVRLDEIPPVIATNLKPAPEGKEETPNVLDSEIGTPQEQNEDTVEPKDKLKFESLESTMEETDETTESSNDEMGEKNSSNSCLLVIQPTNQIKVKSTIQSGLITRQTSSSTGLESDLSTRDSLNVILPSKFNAHKSNFNPNLNDQSEFEGSDSDELDRLRENRDIYKKLALRAKKEGNFKSAIEYMKEMKELQKQIDEYGNAGKPKALLATAPVSVKTSPSLEISLQQRLDKYLSMLNASELENDESLIRRYKRIVDQYADAIYLSKLGKPIPLNTLPNPPGFPPLHKT